MLNRRDLGTKLPDALNVIVEGCNEMGPKRDRICAGFLALSAYMEKAFSWLTRAR